MTDKRVMVIDVEKRQPACAIVQAAFGVGNNNDLLNHFDAHAWITSPTEAMRAIEAPVEDFLRLAAEVNARFASHKEPQ